MGELVGRFKHAYEQHGHKLLKVYCGLPLPRDVHSTKAMKWRAQKLRVWDRPWDKARQQLDDFITALAAGEQKLEAEHKERTQSRLVPPSGA